MRYFTSSKWTTLAYLCYDDHDNQMPAMRRDGLAHTPDPMSLHIAKKLYQEITELEALRLIRNPKPDVVDRINKLTSINELMDYTLPLQLVQMSEAENASVQALLLEYGITWGGNNAGRIVYTDQTLHVSIGGLTYSNRGYVSVQPHLTILDSYHRHVLRWLEVNKIPKQQSTEQHTNQTNMNPYEMMQEDIALKVYDRLKNDTLQQSQIEDLVRDTIAKMDIHKHIIVVEDKRVDPATTTEVNEAAHKCLPELMGVINAGCWAAIVGPTGGGKTLACFQIARLLGYKIVRIKKMHKHLAPHELIGFLDAGGNYKKGSWTDAILGYEHNPMSGYPNCDEPKTEPAMVIVDEMDKANENVMMLIKDLASGVISMPYGQQRVNPKVMVVATMNTWGQGATREYVGAQAQDAALLNEFNFVEWGYDTDFEWTLLQQLFNSYKDVGEYQVGDMRRLLDMFIAMRVKADQQKVRVIISTRNIINVAKMLLTNHDWSIHPTLCKSVYKGLKEEEWKRIECPEMWRAVTPKPKALQQQPAVNLEAAQRRHQNSLNAAEIDPECPI